MGRPAFHAFFVLGQDIGPRQTSTATPELKTKQMLQDFIRHRLFNLRESTASMHAQWLKNACGQVGVVQHLPVLDRTKHMGMRSFMISDMPDQP